MLQFETEKKKDRKMQCVTDIHLNSKAKWNIKNHTKVPDIVIYIYIKKTLHFVKEILQIDFIAFFNNTQRGEWKMVFRNNRL